MKSEEKINAFKDGVEPLDKKLSDLTEEEMDQVAGGFGGSATLDVAREVTQSIFGGNEGIETQPLPSADAMVRLMRELNAGIRAGEEQGWISEADVRNHIHDRRNNEDSI